MAATSVKQKIQRGTLFLFLLLLLCSSVSIYYLVLLKNDSKLILQDNYESLEFCHTMQRSLDSLSIHKALSVSQFETALKGQENNITEPGEEQATFSVRYQFNKMRSGNASDSLIEKIRRDLQSIIALNMSAIEFKNQRAEATAGKALTYISLIGTLVFLIAFTFSFYFPSIITDPINEFTEAIKEIAGKNYSYRIHIKNKDEFGQLADAYNAMAERLEYFESSNINKLLFEKRAEAVINSLKDASIGIDKTDSVLFANNQALSFLGVEAKDIVGQPVAEVSNRNDLFRFLLEEKNTTPFKIVVNNKENYFIKETMEVPQDGGSNSRVIVLKNITSFKELDVAKTNFIATISHELKTPLASSDFSLKLLEDERVSKLTQEQKELIENLKQDNQRMLKILSELLNMSQVEAGRMQLNLQVVNPVIIIENSIQAVLTNAKDKEITIKDGSHQNLPSIHADADKTTWVLNNLLTNAIKYSFNNSIIDVSAIQQNGNILFSVKDYGPGIAKEYIPRLFERYFQVPGSKQKGTGLGLAISKEFIEAQKGSIWVESEIGKGSAFSFRLPIE